MPEIYGADGKLAAYKEVEDDALDLDVEEEEEDLEDLDLEKIAGEGDDVDPDDEGDDDDDEGNEDDDPIDELSDEDAEREARSQGWVPPEEFRGPKTKAVDAKTFLKRGQEILPIVNSKLRERDRQLEELKQEITGLTRAHTAAMKKQAEQFKEKLLAQRNEARENAEWDVVDEVEGKIKEVDKKIDELGGDATQNTKEPTKEEILAIPEIKNWMDSNKWYGTDRRMTRLADAISNDIRAAYPEVSRKEYFERLDAELKSEYPELFAPKQRDKKHSAAGAAGRGGDRARPSGGGGNGKKTFADLPKDARRVCEEQVKEGLFKNKQEYVDIYYGQEE